MACNWFMISIDALKETELYQSAVRDIVAAGFLEEPQTIELVELTGGFLTEEALEVFVRLKR